MVSRDVLRSLKLLRDDAHDRGMNDLAWVYGVAVLAMVVREFLKYRDVKGA